MRMVLTILGGLLLILGLSCRGRRGPDVLKVTLPSRGSLEYRGILVYDAGFHETRKELIWTRRDGTKRVFLINDTHSGYDEIEIRMSKDRKKIWIVDLNQDEHHFGGALNLETGEFYPEMRGLEVRESGPPVDWADKAGGTVLAHKKFH